MAAPTIPEPLTASERQKRRRKDHAEGLISLATVTLPIEPLADIIARYGEPTNAFRRGDAKQRQRHRRSYYRALETGRITAAQADELACAIGRHPVEVWGQAWWEVDEG